MLTTTGENHPPGLHLFHPLPGLPLGFLSDVGMPQTVLLLMLQKLLLLPPIFCTLLLPHFSKVEYMSICIALYHDSSLKPSGMARVNEDHTVLPATHTFIHKWNEPYLPLLHSRRASPHFGRYSFPVLLRIVGCVGLSGSVKH